MMKKMEEDEEIDILGDYDGIVSKTEREISNISAGQILSCDYTVHPRWLTDDNPDSIDYLNYENVGQEVCIENDGGFTTAYSSDDDELEKPQLPTPIHEIYEWANEISAESDIILEEAIPEVSVEEEVVTNAVHHHQSPPTPARKTQQSPNTPSSRSLLKINHMNVDQKHERPKVVPSPPQPNPRSLLKSNYPQFKFKQTLTVDPARLRTNKDFIKSNLAGQASGGGSSRGGGGAKTQNKKQKDVKKTDRGMDIKTTRRESTKTTKKYMKFKQSVKINLNKTNSLIKKKLTKPRKKSRKSSVSSRKSRSGIVFDENITINHNEDQPTTISKGTPLLERNISQAVKLKTVDDESDVEIDIEDGEADIIIPFQQEIPQEAYENQPELVNHLVAAPTKETTGNNEPPDNHDEDVRGQVGKLSESEDDYKTNFMMNLFASCDDDLRSKLETMDVPAEEIRLESSEITELEKLVHFEFFEGRPTKTPDRYMKIRAHILGSWYNAKPSYVSKTAVRSGLKNCGDVNCISRIHALLEQIGAINFGCQGEYFNFVRPLTELIYSFVQPTRHHKSLTTSSSVGSTELERRQRTKSTTKFIDANYTISHSVMDSNSHVTTVTTLPKKRNPSTQKINWSQEYELIRCQQFGGANIAPFKISITISTLLCLYLHSLSSKFEVMGFLGGYRSKSVGRTKLSIARYKPCATSAQSGTMCEMCPVSQVEQSTSLIEEGYALLGWFHSHPLFPPNPSRTDVRTQAEMQIQFSIDDDIPFVGLILGCLDMTCKCIYVMPNDIPLSTENGTPYELNIEVIKDCTNFTNDIMDVITLIRNGENDYRLLIDKFNSYAEPLLQKYGYDVNVFNLLNDDMFIK